MASKYDPMRQPAMHHSCICMSLARVLSVVFQGQSPSLGATRSRPGWQIQIVLETPWYSCILYGPTPTDDGVGRLVILGCTMQYFFVCVYPRSPCSLHASACLYEYFTRSSMHRSHESPLVERGKSGFPASYPGLLTPVKAFVRRPPDSIELSGNIFVGREPDPNGTLTAARFLMLLVADQRWISGQIAIKL